MSTFQKIELENSGCSNADTQSLWSSNLHSFTNIRLSSKVANALNFDDDKRLSEPAQPPVKKPGPRGKYIANFTADNSSAKVVELMQKIYAFLIEAKKEQVQGQTGEEGSKDKGPQVEGAATSDATQRLVKVLSLCPPHDLENLVQSPQGSKLMQDVLKKYCSFDLLLILLSNLVAYQDCLCRLMTNTYSNFFMQTYFEKA